MLRKSSEFYVRVGLAIIMVLLVVNLFKLPGHSLIERAVAAIATITGEGDMNYLTRFVGAANPSNAVGNSIIYDNGTNIGIGTASPGYKLTIAGAGGALAIDNTATFLARNSAGTYDTWMWPRWSDNIMYTNFGSGGWNIRNNSSTNVMFMQNGGNVGIGTTIPGYKLDVQGGQINTSGGLCIAGDCKTAWSQVTGSGVGGSGTAGYIPRFTAGTTVGNSTIQDNATNVGIGTAPTGYKLTVAGDIHSTSGWLRTSNSSGWYNETYGGGWYMTDTTWLRSYNDKYVRAPYFYSSIHGAYLPAGTGSANNLTKWTGTYTVGNSIMSDNGSTVSVSGGLNTTGTLTANIITANNASVGGNWAGLNTTSLKADTSIYSYGKICTGNSLGSCDGTGGATLHGNNLLLKNGGYLFLEGNTSSAAKDWYIQPDIIEYPAGARLRFKTNYGPQFVFGYDGVLTPGAGNNTGSLGTTDLRWGDIYADLPPQSSGYVYVITSGNGQMTYLSSSRETKTDIQPLKKNWKDLLKLDPVMYRDKENKEGPPLVGYIAEDAEKAGLFDLVAYRDGKIVSFYYDRMVVYLLEGLREHEMEIASLKAELESKTEKISDLEARIEKLEELIKK